mgnify:FL=1
MNRPTARFLAACLRLGYDDDDIRLANALVVSDGAFHGEPMGFGRDRRWDALRRIAPELAEALEHTGCDIIYVYEISRADLRRARKAWEEGLKEGPKAAWLAFLNPETTPQTPLDIIRAFARDSLIDEGDRATAGLPLPRDTREALTDG